LIGLDRGVRDRGTGARASYRAGALRVEMQKTGRVEFYTPNRCYGFIRPDDCSPDLFFHVSAVVEGVTLMPATKSNMSKDRATVAATPSLD
jgi:hypothetical protein